MRRRSFLFPMCFGCALVACASGPDLPGADAAADADAGPAGDATDGPIAFADVIPPIPEHPRARGGTRLKAQVYATEDGVSFPRGSLYDSEQAQACAFERAGDGELRCLPRTGWGNRRFADAGCTEELLSLTLSEGCPLPNQVGLREGECDAERARVYQVGKRLKVTAYYRRDDDGSCQKLSVDPELRGIFERGDEVLPETYVRAEEVLLGARNPRFAERVHRAEDGAQEHVSYFDVARGGDCQVESMASGTRRCVPRTPCFMSSIYFADDACAERLVWPHGCAERCAEVLDHTTEGCAPFVDVFEVGAKLTASRYTLSADQCQASSASSASDYFALGQQLPEQLFFEVSTAIEPGSARLGRRWLLFGGEGRVQDLSAHDRLRDETCWFTRAADGTMRCMPSSGPQVALATRFADSRCTQRMARRYEDDCQTTHYLRSIERVGCELRTHLFLAGETVARDTYYTLSSAGECSAHDVAGTYVLAGKELAPEQFVEVFEALE